MITEQEIINFIEKEFWKSNLNSDSDIFETMKITGDDCEELLFKYKEKFDVDFDFFYGIFIMMKKHHLLLVDYFLNHHAKESKEYKLLQKC